MMKRALRQLSIVTAVMWTTLCGCSAKQETAPDPNQTLSAPDASRHEQVAAVKKLAADLLEGRVDAAAGREGLKRIAWRRGMSSEVRLAAIEPLLENDHADTVHMLSLMLPTETDWALIGRVCDLAVENDWVDLTDALVRSWSRVVIEPPDDQRPERAALVALHPNEPVEEVVYRVFATPTDDKLFGEKARIDAWGLLQRIDRDGAETRALLLADATPDAGNALLADLHAGARQLRIVPRTAEQLQWLRDMRQPEHRAFWTDAARAIASLDESQLAGFALRHVAGVHWAAAHEPEWLGASREELLSKLRDRLSGRRHDQRTDGVTDMMAQRRETLHDWDDKLSWGDALMILIADRAIAEPSVVVALFEQAIRDQGDRSTELGGVLDAAGDGFIATLYPPRPIQRLGDRRFVASSELLNASADALFHYHFHAQQSNNREFAGPGRGDIEYADRFGRACIVFTFISADRLDADYYQPDGARIDLGEIRNPR